MEEQRTITDILKASGRLQESDEERALAYQREHGGYLGEVLVELGMVTTEEIEWSLASQLDVPYVVPDAESVDTDTVRLVTPEWALANLTVPIMLADGVLTVVVDQPERRAAAEELGKRTDSEVSLALASPANIRRLIREVFARRVTPGEGERTDPVTLAEGLGIAVASGTDRFGVSRRGPRSIFWFHDHGTIRRIPMMPGWLADLDAITAPAIGPRVADQERTAFDTELNLRGIHIPVGVRFLADESGDEFLFLPREAKAVGRRYEPPPPAILQEVRMLCRNGAARFVLTTDPDELGHDLLPHLPDLLFEEDWRAIYINADEQSAADRAFSLRMPKEAELWNNELATLREFAFDVVTVDLTGNVEDWAATALDVAPVAFLLWPSGGDVGAAADAGMRWRLHVTEGDGGALAWTLQPLGT